MQGTVDSPRAQLPTAAYDDTIERRRAARTRWMAIGVLCVVGALQAWASRHFLASDGLAYLDIAHLYRDGQWALATNAYWSPLYSLVLALTLALGNPSPAWETPAVHLANFAIFLLTIWSFDRMMAALIQLTARRAPQDADHRPLHDWQVMLLGYAALGVVTLDWITLGSDKPDLLVAALVFVMVTLTVRVVAGTATAWTYAAFGAAAGLGYLAKTAVLPVAAVWLVCLTLAVPRDRTAVRRLAMAAGIFAVLVVPQALRISRELGYLTFGGTSAYNYARDVDGSILAVDWQGNPPGFGSPIHPTRRVLDNPAVYEFASPISGTYPPWNDPAYWYDGLQVHVDVRRQARVVLDNAALYGRLLSGRDVGDATGLDFTLFVCLALLLAAGGGWRAANRAGLTLWPVLVPVVSALVMYSLLHVEPRFVAGYVAVVVVVVVVSMRVVPTPASWRLALAATVIGGGAVWSSTLVTGRIAWTRMRAERFDESAPDLWQLRAGRALTALGVGHGTRLAFIGRSYQFYWARVAEARVVAEIRQFEPTSGRAWYAFQRTSNELALATQRSVDAFWSADSATRGRVYRTFASAGASWVVTDSAPPNAEPGWVRLGNTSYRARRLAPAP